MEEVLGSEEGVLGSVEEVLGSEDHFEGEVEALRNQTCLPIPHYLGFPSLGGSLE